MDRISVHRSQNIKQHSISYGFARLFSDLMNPLFIPPLVIGITTWMLGGSAKTIGWVIIPAILFYTLIPLAGAFYLLKTDQIVSLDLPDRKSRRKLYCLATGCAAAVFLFYFATIPPVYELIPLLSLIFLTNLSFAYGINEIWKISIHTATISSAAAIFLYLTLFETFLPGIEVGILSLVILLLLLLLMIWARYRLTIHSLAELLGGVFSGFLLTILQLTILIKIW